MRQIVFNEADANFNRRDFIKTATGIGVTSLFSVPQVLAASKSDRKSIETRGKKNGSTMNESRIK